MDRLVPVNIFIHSLDSVLAGAKHTVPETSLLAVVAASLPALAVVQVVILNDKLSLEPLQDKRERVRRRRLHTESTVSGHLGKNDILMTHPPGVEVKRQSNSRHAKVCEQRDDGNVPDLLLLVGVQRQQRVRVLGEVVRAVELPECLDLVHQPVVPVEPEVEDDAVQPDLHGQQVPVDVCGGHACAVGQEDSEERAHGRRGDEREEDLGDADIRYLVAVVFVAVEEADLVARRAERVDLVDCVELEEERV